MIGTCLPAALAQAPVTQPRQQENLSQRLERLEQMLGNQGLLDLLQQLEQVQQEVSRLRGEIELQNYNLQQIQNRQRVLYTDTDQRLQRLEGGSPTASTVLMDQPQDSLAAVEGATPPLQTLTPVYGPDQSMMNTQGGADLPNTLMVQTITPAAPAGSNTGPVSEAPPVTSLLDESVTGNTSLPAGGAQEPLSTDALPQVAATGMPETTVDNPALVRAEYDQAFSLLKAAQYDQAIMAFRAFLEKYPRAQYSDNAQYWLGECFYVMRQFESAITEYENLTSNYPQSQKYTHALLKIGYSYQELGLINETRQYLDMLIRQYPDTTASRLAQARLQQIAMMEKQ